VRKKAERRRGSAQRGDQKAARIGWASVFFLGIAEGKDESFVKKERRTYQHSWK